MTKYGAWGQAMFAGLILALSSACGRMPESRTAAPQPPAAGEEVAVKGAFDPQEGAAIAPAGKTSAETEQRRGSTIRRTPANTRLACSSATRIITPRIRATHSWPAIA